jgi:hypothetical protein
MYRHKIVEPLFKAKASYNVPTQEFRPCSKETFFEHPAAARFVNDCGALPVAQDGFHPALDEAGAGS